VRENPLDDGSGLELFGRLLVVLAIVGLVAMLALATWGLGMDQVTLPRATVEQVLGALEGGGDSWLLIGPAIDALRAALEQPEQEPDRWGAGYEAGYAAGMAEMKPEQEPLFVVEGGELRPLRPALLNDGDKLYTHPPRREWRSLSEEEVDERLAYCAGWWAAMEQKREQPAQEPVAIPPTTTTQPEPK
jgi:hypothetical protein